MLSAIEIYLKNAIENVLPAQITVVAGPHKPTVTETVVIHARQLEIAPLVEGEEDEGAFLVQEVEWAANGTDRSFDIPGAFTGAVLEIQSPPGVLVEMGEQVYLEGRTLHFYRAPGPADPGVQARLRGDIMPGWKRQRDCLISLELTAWSPSMSDSDSYMAASLNVSLAEMVELPIFALPRTTGVDVHLRLLTPRVSLVSVERCAHPTEPLFGAQVSIELLAKLDILVASGAPTQEGIIDTIERSIALKQVSPAT